MNRHAHCPSGHTDRNWPYPGEASCWCQECGEIVLFKPVIEPVIPSRIVTMPPHRITRAVKPASFRVPAKNRYPYKD